MEADHTANGLQGKLATKPQTAFHKLISTWIISRGSRATDIRKSVHETKIGITRLEELRLLNAVQTMRVRRGLG